MLDTDNHIKVSSLIVTLGLSSPVQGLRACQRLPVINKPCGPAAQTLAMHFVGAYEEKRHPATAAAVPKTIVKSTTRRLRGLHGSDAKTGLKEPKETYKRYLQIGTPRGSDVKVRGG